MKYNDEVSTFAWYTASSTASLTAVEHVGSLNTTVNGSITGLTVTIAYNAQTKAGADNNPDLTNADGEVHYYVGSVRNATNSDGIGVLTFTPDWGSATPADKALMLNHKYKAFIKGEGNVRILADNPASAAESNVAMEDTNSTEGYAVYITNDGGTLKVCRTQNGTYTTSIDVNYAVRTNNPYGLECFLSSESSNPNYVSGQAVTATEAPATPAPGDAYIDAENHFKVWDGDSWEDGGYAHTADKIYVGVGDQVA